MFPTDLDDFLNRLPNDPQWQTREVGNEGNLKWRPALYINSWYDVSIFRREVAMFSRVSVENRRSRRRRHNIL